MNFMFYALICYMIVCYVLCELYTWSNVYGKRGTLGLENITLGVQEKNEQDSSEC